LCRRSALNSRRKELVQVVVAMGGRASTATTLAAEVLLLRSGNENLKEGGGYIINCITQHFGLQLGPCILEYVSSKMECPIYHNHAVEALLKQHSGTNGRSPEEHYPTDLRRDDAPNLADRVGVPFVGIYDRPLGRGTRVGSCLLYSQPRSNA
jgi:hypothetical protein